MFRFGTQHALLFSLCLALLGAVLLAAATHWPGELSRCLALVPFGGGCGSAFATATEVTLGTVSAERRQARPR